MFMEPKWLHRRLNLGLDYSRQFLTVLQDSIATADLHGIRDSLFRIATVSASLPLYLVGTTPSSTRLLAQVSAVAPETRRQICELLSSFDFTLEITTGLIDTCENYIHLMDRTYASGAGRYLIQKARFMAEHGERCEAAFVLLHVRGEITHSRIGDHGCVPHCPR